VKPNLDLTSPDQIENLPSPQARWDAFKMHRLPWGAALDDEDINEKWDRWWSLRISEVEWNLSRQTGASGSAASLTPPDQQRTWIGFRPSTFLTPYAELDQIVQATACGPGSRWIDLGAGYGRLAWVLEAYEVGHEFLGLEVVSERVKEGRSAMQTCGLNRSQLLQQDLQDPAFLPPLGDCYLLYDYGSLEAIRKTLEDLKRLSTLQASEKRFLLIARGGLTRSWIAKEHPWLTVKQEVDTQKPLHFPNFSVYES
jgi:hypothetical protein